MDAWSANKQLPARPLTDEQVTAFINRDLIPILRTLRVAPADRFTFVRKTADYTAAAFEAVLVDATAGTFTVTLPNPSGVNYQKVILVKSVTSDPTAVTIAGTIDGETSTTMYGMYAAKAFIADGTSWRLIWRDPGKGDELNSHLIWSPDDDDWRPGNVIPRTIPNWYSPVGLWQFTRGFPNGVNDQSGHGYDLAAEAGFVRYSWMHPGIQGYLFDGTNRLWRSASTAALQLLGDMSVVFIATIQEFPAAASYFFSHGAAGETSDTNVLYSNVMNFAGDAYITEYFHEQGGGVNVNFDVGSAAFFPNVITMWGFSRTLSGGNVTVTHYNQGNPWATASATPVTAPTDGSNGKFRIGGFDGSGYFKGLMAGFAIYNTALTAAQHKALFNYCLGPAFGLKP